MTRQRHIGWLLATVAFGTFGVAAVLGNLWIGIVGGEWLALLATPVAVLFYGWLTLGSWQRANR